MQKAGNSAKTAKSPRIDTFNVIQLDNSRLSSSRGVQLPPLSAKGCLQPDQVANSRFRLVEVEAQPLSDQQFNVLIKRLVKCFMSEVEITKRLRKVSSRRSLQPADVELIRNLEALRRNYEFERSGLVVKLSRDCRFRFYDAHKPQSMEKQSGKSCKARKSRSLEIVSKNNEQKTTNYDIRTARHRQSGGFQPQVALQEPIVCNYIATPVSLAKRLQEKLYRLQKISKSRTEPDESEPTEAEESDIAAKSSSTEIFYDFIEKQDVYEC